ncbi:MAG: aspartate--tRNA ligase, partial [Desulfobacterota bacterium]|nr:aspartate--tRNA ligase [Thermodesulfobacteriota bacterium]
KRTYCGDLTPPDAGKDILLMGWVDAFRDHGSLRFIHLRDVRGIVQVVFNPEIGKDSYDKAAGLKEEYVIEVRGKVALRRMGTDNPNLRTGTIEVLAEDMEVLSLSRTLPFKISEKAIAFGEDIKANPEKVDEELRLQYRYLDLRRPSAQELFIKRYKLVKCIRTYLDELHFTEIETPFLTKSTPEGARDYLVPSRVHKGKFYSLPQSPQLFKQLLMMSGMDRYFQIARCFRDEDLRPNRQPEFTQLDLEASFIDEEFIYEMIEELTVRMFSLGGISLPRPFPRMTYDTAMERYGSDRPDLRFDMAFEEVTDLLRETQYAVFRQLVRAGGCIKGFCVKGQADVLSKNVLQNEYAIKIAPSLGAKGMTWMKVANGRLESNIVQFFSKTELDRLRDRFRAGDGDVLIMIADTDRDLVNKVLSALRLHLAERLKLIPEDRYEPLWVTDFPLFELKDGKLGSQHHPFTMPDRVDFDPANKQECLALKSRAYDLVMNGEELGGGSIRIHRMDIQKKIFLSLELTEEELEAKFGFFLRALEYGAPPHGGLALGLDRVIAMILKASSIREVIAFPKNRSAFCPLSQAPSFVEGSQLKELSLAIPSAGFAPERMTTAEVKAGTAASLSERVSPDHVRHIARLARLKLTESEVHLYQKDLNSILEYVETLRDLDAENVRPMSHVIPMKNVWREDKLGKEGKAEEILSNAPAREKDFFKVPKIIEG